MSKPKLTDQDFCRASKKLKCEVAAIKAVAEVESLRNSFYADGFPVILFERHKFRAFTDGAYNKSHPQISGPAGNYGSAGQNQRNKFNLAFKLNPKAAMKSCSWGAFQIMGFNHELCGFASVDSFVDAMKESEGRQLDAFVEFVISTGLADELRNKEWADFARGYNGAGYKQNKYDTKMAAAYKKFAKENIDCSQVSAVVPKQHSDLAPDKEVPQNPAEQPPTNQETTFEMTSEGISASSSSPSHNVVIEKKEGWLKRKWKELVAYFTGLGGLDGATQYASQAQTLGLSPDFWKRIFYLGLAAVIVYLAFDWYKDYQERKLTNKLVDANSTATNMVAVASTSQIESYEKDPNWEVVKHG